MIAGDTQAMTDVSKMAQKLMSTCEGAMTIINCANTESDEHDTANAAFDEAATHFEELGYVYEMTLDGVVFSRSEPDAGEHDPDAKIAAAAFLGLEGAVDLGSLDQVVDVAAYKGFNRCPVLVCPEVKVNGVRSTYYTNSAQIRPSFTRRGDTPAVCIGSPLRITPALSKRVGYSIAKRTWSSVAGCMG
jgi:hypothetical protein